MTTTDSTLPPNAASDVTAKQSPAPPLTPLVAAPVNAAIGLAPPPSPISTAKVEQPSTEADYLQNPKPVYPALSKRMGEQGQVIHNVLIGSDGLPVNAKLVKSSGFDRLDQAAHKAVMGWRYVPGKRNGVPTPMTYNVPINWVLE